MSQVLVAALYAYLHIFVVFIGASGSNQPYFLAADAAQLLVIRRITRSLTEIAIIQNPKG